MIIGTNATGKSSLARELINRSGGIAFVANKTTYCNDGRTSVIGDYSKHKNIEGVDAFGETKCLSTLVQQSEREIVVFEGLKCGTFGLSIQKALFQNGGGQIVVFLYASAQTINKRLLERTGFGIRSKAVLAQQKANLRAAIKYKEIGVKVVSFDTDIFSTSEIADEVEKLINEK